MKQDGRFIKDFWVQETPSGTINGLNLNFSLSQTPKEPAVVMLFVAGVFIPQGLGYSITGTALTLVAAPVSTIVAVYVRKTGE